MWNTIEENVIDYDCDGSAELPAQKSNLWNHMRTNMKMSYHPSLKKSKEFSMRQEEKQRQLPQEGEQVKYKCASRYEE